MGESLLDSPTNVENQMDESGADQVQVGKGGASELRVSISFGKYENEPLSWEKWSAFPTNKYLEEVEKYSTPGSVAQKKAYFEAHYKRIAARKSAEQQQQALQIDQDKNKGNEVSGDQQPSVEDQTTRDSDGNNCVEKSKVENDVNTAEIHCGNDGGVSEVDYENGGVEEVEYGNEGGVEEVEYGNEGGVNVTSIIGDACVDQPCFDADVQQSKDSQLVVEDSEDRFGIRPDSPKSNKAEELVFIKEEAPSLGSQDMEESQPEGNVDKETGPGAHEAIIEEPQQDVNSGRESTLVQNQEKVKSDTPKKRQQKVSATKNPNTMASAKKKPASPTPRPTSTPKTAKSALAKSLMSTPKTASPVLAKSVMSTPKTAKQSKSVMIISKTSKPAPSYSAMSTPKTAKPTLSKSVMSTTKSLVKKENKYTPLTTNKKTTSKTESKRMAPTSLHMSLSLGPVKSESTVSLPETRKSLFMESMGDKEIVRRAFKAFQTRYNQQASSGLRKPSPERMQASMKETQTGGPPVGTSHTKSEGAAKGMKKAGVLNNPQGSRRNSMSSGYNLRSLNDMSLKTGSADQRNVGIFSPSPGLRSLDKVEKPKELSKKSEEGLNRKLAAKTQVQLQTRPKVQKGEETKKLGQNLKLDSKPTTASYPRPWIQSAH